MKNPLQRIKEWMKSLCYCPYYKRCKHFTKTSPTCTQDWPNRYCGTFRTFENQEIDEYMAYLDKKHQEKQANANKQKRNP